MNLQLAVVIFVVSLIPGGAAAVPVITAAWPVLSVAIPVAIALIEKGVPMADAFAKAHPEFIAKLKMIIAKVLHGDETKAPEISDDEVIVFARPLIGVAWTKADRDRAFAKATGQS